MMHVKPPLYSPPAHTHTMRTAPTEAVELLSVCVCGGGLFVHAVGRLAARGEGKPRA